MTDRNRGADHTLLRRLQVQVGDRLEKAVTDRARAGQPAMSGEDEEAFKPSSPTRWWPSTPATWPRRVRAACDGKIPKT